MKLSLLIFVTLMAPVRFVDAAPAPVEDAPKNEVIKKKTEGSQTEHSFEDLLVQGKYHFSDESVTTVEEDKVLDALIGVRNDFKDRLENSSERN